MKDEIKHTLQNKLHRSAGEKEGVMGHNGWYLKLYITYSSTLPQSQWMVSQA